LQRPVCLAQNRTVIYGYVVKSGDAGEHSTAPYHYVYGTPKRAT
jgi:hypothetical protein